MPLLKAGLVQPTGIIADSLSGVSGAGRKAELDYLFVECNESVRPYGMPKHRHLSEIEQELSLAAGTPVVFQFTPHLIPVNRGILTTLYLAPVNPGPGRGTGREHRRLLPGCLCQEPFVRLLEGKALPDTKNVVGTNVIEIAWRVQPAHRSPDGDERRGQPPQGRQRAGGAEHEPDVRLRGNGRVDVSRSGQTCCPAQGLPFSDFAQLFVPATWLSCIVNSVCKEPFS